MLVAAHPSHPGETIIRWIARGTGTVLFCLWGAFFVEHLSWFFEHDEFPPPFVWGMQGLHLMMLVGLLVGWRWEVPGAVLVLAGGIPFFAYAAGRNAVPFILITGLPAVLWLYCAWRNRSHHAPPDSHPMN